MIDTTSSLRHAILPAIADRTGLFTWDMVADKLSGDAEMSRLFLLDEQDFASGVPVQALIDRLHPDDRELVARSLHTAIVNNTQFREFYRVEAEDGGYYQVLSLARCFGYENGLPSVCSGFVCEMRPFEKLAQPRYSDGENVVPFNRSDW